MAKTLCPVVPGNLGNQTVLNLFAICALNYNHFLIKLRESQHAESSSGSVRDTSTGCLRTTPCTQLCNLP